MAAMAATIGEFQILARLGGGASGAVYRALHGPSGREVAIKVLSPSLAADPEARAAFRAGAGCAAAVRHPNILPVWGYDEAGAAPLLVMPCVAGGTLAGRIARGPVPVPEALGYLAQLAAALDALHARGIVHRDLKPANVLLDGAGRPLLADFGLALAVADPARPTRTGEGIGTPEYLAPEQARGLPEAASDRYALGVMLYELLTGRVPFAGGSPVAVMLRQLRDPLPLGPLCEARLSLPAAIIPVLDRALAKDPADRYPNAAALVAAARAALLPAPVVAPVRPAVPPPARALARPIAGATLAASLLLGSAGGFGAWLAQRELPAGTASAALIDRAPLPVPPAHP